MTLVCFAVKEEEKAFKESAATLSEVLTLLTGIGPKNAERTIRKALAETKPSRVLTCGFAGGLRPDLKPGDVVFNCEHKDISETAFIEAGAKPGRFHCIPRIATSADEKKVLWVKTGADAVEMESQVICDVCREHSIPCAIVRVILDAADEDLPLDFNRLMNPSQQMDYGKLALTLMKSPGKIGALRRLQSQSNMAARKLAEVVVAVLKPTL